MDSKLKAEYEHTHELIDNLLNDCIMRVAEDTKESEINLENSMIAVIKEINRLYKARADLMRELAKAKESNSKIAKYPY